MPDVLMDIRVERKAFAGDTVLRDIALSLRLGEVVSLLGPSGCGKSTLLRIVARLEQDFRGSVERVQGEVAFVFQEPRLMPWLTVEQNIGFSDDDSYDRAWVKQLIE
ncbi:ATP-binding cassette domain-containing protein, partial [Pseudomonas coronafaciens]